jgi:hypothetical protein
MKIEVINSENEPITNFELETNPFKVGENFSILITQFDASSNLENKVKADSKITKIEHQLRKVYHVLQGCETTFVTIVTVEAL